MQVNALPNLIVYINLLLAVVNVYKNKAFSQNRKIIVAKQSFQILKNLYSFIFENWVHLYAISSSELSRKIINIQRSQTFITARRALRKLALNAEEI